MGRHVHRLRRQLPEWPARGGLQSGGEIVINWDAYATTPDPRIASNPPLVLGLFNNTTKTLTASNLPKHYAVRLQVHGIARVHGGGYGEETRFKVIADGDELQNARLDDGIVQEWMAVGGDWTFEHDSTSFTASFTGEGFEVSTEDWWLTSAKLTLIQPVVSVSGGGEVYEGDTEYPATVSVSRTGPTTSPLSVDLRYSGTASLRDLTVLPMSVTIPAGQTSKEFEVRALDDLLVEGTEDRLIHIRPKPDYVVGATPATVFIFDDDGWYDPIDPQPPQKPSQHPPPRITIGPKMTTTSPLPIRRRCHPSLRRRPFPLIRARRTSSIS